MSIYSHASSSYYESVCPVHFSCTVCRKDYKTSSKEGDHDKKRSLTKDELAKLEQEKRRINEEERKKREDDKKRKEEEKKRKEEEAKIDEERKKEEEQVRYGCPVQCGLYHPLCTDRGKDWIILICLHNLLH